MTTNLLTRDEANVMGEIIHNPKPPRTKRGEVGTVSAR